jgi:hypothetical protein
MSNKNKHVNIRITDTVNKQIDSIKKELEKESGMSFSRSQVIFMLIVRGIEKYVENRVS